jgi:hypothetical protein
MVMDGYVLILDEFQYFNRIKLAPFCSHLQAVVDRLRNERRKAKGGLIVLGSIHTEMMALLDDRSAPLYNRVTDSIELTHLDIGSILEILRDHADAEPERLLFLWNLFEGVPKYYRDCYEEGVLPQNRAALLRRIFFESSSPLRAEVDNWFLRELRGRYDVLLKYVARNPGCTHKEMTQAVREGSNDPETQVGGYLQHLVDRFRFIERRQPIFSKPSAYKGRYYVTDNFLRSWLAALAKPVSAIAFRDVAEMVREADLRLENVEGGSLEKLARELYQERGRKKVGDFPLTDLVQGYWDKADTEIDLVALNEDEKVIRFGTCKRSPKKLVTDINNFKSHVQRFLTVMPKYERWTKELVGIAPRLDADQRKSLCANDLIPQDLNDLTKGL